MSQRHEEFMKRLLVTFMLEAQEHADTISTCLLELEKAPEARRSMELIETAFREAHSLKGAARAVNLTTIESVCQSMEAAFAGLKERRIELSSELLDALHAAAGAISLFVRSDGSARAEAERRMAEAARVLAGHKEGPAVPPEAAAPARDDAGPVQAEPRGPVDTVRIATAKLERLLVGTEELLTAKLTTAQRVAEAREAAAALDEWPRRWAGVRRETQAGGTLPSPRLADFLEWNAALVESLYRRLQLSARSLNRDREALDQMVDRLQDDVKTTLMQPIATLLDAAPKVARDLARDRGKEIEVTIRGTDLEVDRRILEEMKDPLVHLIRNCIDHGIERPAERREKGKPVRGVITITIATREANLVELLIADDGAGVDVGRLRAASVKLGLLSSADADTLNTPATLALAFHSGVTTSPMITDISGRGLGLAIVRDKVERLGGTVALTTEAGAGTTIRVVLPTVLATFRGIIVRVSDHLFVLPLASVRRAIRVSPEMIRTVENRETVALDGRAVALARLGDALGVPRAMSSSAETIHPAVVTGTADRSIAFLVDETLGEQEVVAKPLGPHLSDVGNYTGAAVLGTGRVAPILNVPHLMETAVRAPVAAMGTPVPPAPRPRTILVVEDSITARSLIRGILEAAGYAVATAVDGAEALATLRTGTFDLVVSDVDMPRMNGFDLTARIRADQRLADLPVVLVTALESREDRERGVDVGANAYIVKSSFDQSNLLDVIARLV